MQYSPQQLHAIDTSKKAPKLSLNAFAGCSKSTTLFAIAQANPDKNYLLLVFSKALQTETEKKLKSMGIKNVEPKTTHSLAYSIVFANKYKVTNKNYKAYDLVNRYGITLNASYLALEVINKYFNSDDTSYIIQFNKYKKLDKRITQGIIKVANRFVKEMREGKMDVTHSFYLKEYQLKVVNEGVKYKKYQGVMLDEAQDTNIVTKSIFDHIDVKYKIKVGDDFQGIFGWREAVNIMSDTEGWEVAYLTTSFRTPKALAGYTDRFLKTFRNTTETFNGFREEIEPVSAKDSFAVISRTNSGMIKYMFRMVEKEKKFKTIRHPDEIFSAVMDISKIGTDFQGDIKNKSFLQIPSMLEQYNTENDKKKTLFSYIKDELEDIDREAYQAVNLINQYGIKELHSLRKKALDYYHDTSSKINVYFTTAHGSKGLEWDNILICDDYPNLFELAYNIADKHVKNLNFLTYEQYARALKEYDNEELWFDELNLFYVACTRAMKTLKIDGENNVYVGDYNKEYLINMIKAIHKAKLKDKQASMSGIEETFDKEIRKELPTIDELKGE